MILLDPPNRHTSLTPDPGPDDAHAPSFTNASAPALQGAIDFDHFAMAHASALTTVSAIRPDPMSLASDKACTDTCGTAGVLGALGGGAAAIASRNFDKTYDWGSKGYAVSEGLCRIGCAADDARDATGADPRAGMGGTSGVDLSTGGAGGATGEGPGPAMPPATDPPTPDPNDAPGGFTRTDGGQESNAGKTDASTNSSSTTTTSTTNTSSDTSSTDSTDSSSSSSDNGRADSSNGSGQTPVDFDGGGYNGGYSGVDPRLANPKSFALTELAALEFALEAARQASDRLNSNNGQVSSVLPGLNLRG